MNVRNLFIFDDIYKCECVAPVVVLLLVVIVVVVGWIGLSSAGGVTSLGEGKTLNSKPEGCCSGESVAH